MLYYKLSSTVKRLLDLLIRTDPRGLLYQEEIDRNLFTLLDMGLDLKNYFNSQMGIYKIDNDYSDFPDYHGDGKLLAVPCNLKSIPEIHYSYWDVLAPKLPQKKKTFN